MNDVKALVEIYDFIGDIYKKNSKKSPSTSRYYYVILCQKYAKISETVLKMGIYTFVIFHIIFDCLLIADSVYQGKMVPPLRIYFPIINENSIDGALFLIIYNYAVIVIGYTIMFTYDLLIFIIFANIPMVADVIIGHLDELKEALMESDCSPREIQQRMLCIIRMHNKYTE